MADGGEEKGKNNDFYQVLGLNKECSATELRSAYKKLALRWHPDRCSASGNSKFVEEAQQKFQAIQQAYSVLSDTNKRFLYDVGVYDSDDDENGMGDFLNEMAVMMSQTKPSANKLQPSPLQTFFVFSVSLLYFCKTHLPISLATRKFGFSANSSPPSSANHLQRTHLLQTIPCNSIVDKSLSVSSSPLQTHLPTPLFSPLLTSHCHQDPSAPKNADSIELPLLCCSASAPLSLSLCSSVSLTVAMAFHHRRPPRVFLLSTA